MLEILWTRSAIDKTSTPNLPLKPQLRYVAPRFYPRFYPRDITRSLVLHRFYAWWGNGHVTHQVAVPHIKGTRILLRVEEGNEQ